MTFSRWDVVAVNFPFLEGDEAKRRPALVVSSEVLHREHGVFWVVMITTAKKGARDGDIPITNHGSAGLPENCVIRVSRITAVANSHLARRIGQVTAKDRNAVTALLKRYLP